MDWGARSKPMKEKRFHLFFFFLSQDEAKFFETLCELIVPSGETTSDPGAREVGTVNYIDSTLADFPPEVQGYFIETIKLVDEISKRRFGKIFSDLPDFESKDAVLRELYAEPKTRERLFDLRSLVLEGFYSDYTDPWYDGTTPWKALGFEGKGISGLKKDWSFLRIWREWEKKK